MLLKLILMLVEMIESLRSPLTNRHWAHVLAVENGIANVTRAIVRVVEHPSYFHHIHCSIILRFQHIRRFFFCSGLLQ